MQDSALNTRIWLICAIATTIGALGLYIVMQQIERQGANDPQVQIAEDGAAALEHGQPASRFMGNDTVDVSRSLAPFVVVLDDAGKPLASSGLLDGRIPVPPAGVFNAVRTSGEGRITWAPRRSIRLASVVRRVPGPQPGFIVAARSLREVEGRIGRIGQLIGIGWLVGMAALTIAVALGAWMASRR